MRQLDHTLSTLADASKVKDKALIERNAVVMEHARMQQEFMVLEELVCATKTAKSEVTRKHDLLKSSLFSSNQNLMLATSAIKKLRQENEELKKQNGQMKLEKNHLRDALRQANATIEDTAMERDVMQKENESLHKTVEQLNTNIAASVQRARNMNKHQHHLKRKINKIERAHDVMGDKMVYAMEKSRELCIEKQTLQDRVFGLEYSMNNHADLASLDLTALAYLVTHGDWAFIDTQEHRYNQNAAVVQKFILQGRDTLCALATQHSTLEQNYEELERNYEHMWGEGLTMWKEKQALIQSLKQKTVTVAQLEAELETTQGELAAKETNLFHAQSDAAGYKRALEAATAHMQGNPSVEESAAPDLRTRTPNGSGDVEDADEAQDNEALTPFAADMSVHSADNDSNDESDANSESTNGISSTESVSSSLGSTASQLSTPTQATEDEQESSCGPVNFKKFLAMVREISRNKNSALVRINYPPVRRNKKPHPRVQLGASTDLSTHARTADTDEKWPEPAADQALDDTNTTPIHGQTELSPTLPPSNATSGCFTFGTRDIKEREFSFPLQCAAVNPFTPPLQRSSDDMAAPLSISSHALPLKKSHFSPRAHENEDRATPEENEGSSETSSDGQISSNSTATNTPPKVINNNKNKRQKTKASRKSRMISNYYGTGKKAKRNSRN